MMRQTTILRELNQARRDVEQQLAPIRSAIDILMGGR